MYNRDYITNNSNTNHNTYTQEEQTGHKSKAGMMAFLRATYQLFAGSLLAATAGAYIGLDMASTISSWYWGLVILEFALLFGLYAVKDKPGINLAVLFGFTFISGLTITPLLSSVFMMPGGASIVAQAFLMTSVAFGGISMFALTTKRDFSGMGKMLFIALIIMIVGSISNIFIGSSVLQLGIAMAGALLFSAFILYDTQQIIKGNYSTPIEAAIALYLDFLNLFISLLQILAAFNSKDD
ncbi:MAG: Bax inhibitor-1/YccA family protein [Campylobacteraceae bacterium]|jgi:modulator of FtsH protease|nr:Bax inhibitor-1/YccA family protein [Campylobacteraceae bacterium]MBT3882193.1 Bax inhibitor-1/YccA family protein [Campylobacteraceae bacterium]MBT4031164.1 Bax inhibitor-1/YccA family protein [Campylobacteraceae bacterium]MBT4179038.1 Bax inhibitor-1/YccA family protein [Campylobacteraceae bacterium]MBT4572578.1 Bax inhibitor-1/YccA family protein [Campylobacteraceae bacterium]